MQVIEAKSLGLSTEEQKKANEFVRFCNTKSPVKSKIFKAKNFREKDDTKSGSCEKSFELIFNLIMETFSTIDLGTDAYLIYKFAKSEHMAWLCVNIQTLIWPFFVAYVPFISYRLGRIRKESKEGKSSNI